MPIHDWTRVDAGIFHDFHQEWISRIKGALNAGLLPVDYYALIEQVAGGLIPDVLTLESVHAGPSGPSGDEAITPDATGSGGVALATAAPKVRFTATTEIARYARKRSRVAIRHRSGDRVVAIVEIVSPGNKAQRFGLQAFVEKALQLLDAGVHLLVLDLFPPGPLDPQGIHGAIWSAIEGDDFRLPADERLTLVAYSAGEVEQAFIEPVAVGDALPDMPLFLLPGRYVPVPLEATYREAFDAVPKRWREQLAPPAAD
jgi:hypothetical protein